MSDNNFDVIIIGAGPAGLTAAIYAGRRELKTLVLSKDIGGQATKTNEIENYPGFDHISGAELSTSMYNQGKKFGVQFAFEEVVSLKKNAHFTVSTPSTEYTAKTLILAFGKKPRELDVPGEKRLAGKGVTYCATCDAPFFRNKNVAVVGGGNSALDAALVAGAVAKKVYLIHRRDEFRGEAVLLENIDKTANIEKKLNANIAEILGENKVSAVKLDTGEELEVDGVIVEIGFIIDRKIIEGFVDLDPVGQIIIGKGLETSLPGVFAAGDITTTRYKQIVISAGEGATAALSAFDFIQRSAGKQGIVADWH